MAQQTQSEIRYLTPPSVDVKKKKYCRFIHNASANVPVGIYLTKINS